MKTGTNLKGFGRIMGCMKPRMGRYLIGLISSGAFNAASTILLAYVLKDLVDATVNKNIQYLYRALILVGVVIVMLCIAYPVFEYFYQSSIKKTVADIRLKLFSHLEEVTIQHIEQMHSGDVLSRMNNDLELLERSYADDLRNVCVIVMNGGFSLILMFTLDWRISLILLFFGLITWFVDRLFAVPLKNIAKKLQEKTAAITSILTDMFSGFQTVKSLNLKGILLKKYEAANTQAAKDTVKKAGISALLDGTNFLLGWFNFGGCIVIGSLMVMAGQTTFGKLVAIAQLLVGVGMLFQQLGGFLAQFQVSLVGAERVFELMDKEREPVRYNLPGMEQQVKESGEIVFDKVSFAYENGVKALENVTLSIPKGSAIALVGASGSGKSTIIKILLGLYCPDEGGISLSGKDIGEYSLDSVRSLMAYVPQDSYLFNVSIRENIRFGKPDAADEEIIAAAKLAFAHDFILEQPNGYDTLVGERGQSLSGGQKQRIAIARAFLKNAPILLLDEATSSLDSKSEDLVQEALEKLMKGRTTITIAHRPSTIQNADILFELDHGTLNKGV